MSYEINAPVDFINSNPVNLTLTDTTASNVWQIATTVSDTTTIGTTTDPDILEIFPISVGDPSGAIQTHRIRLTENSKSINIYPDPALSADYTFNMPAVAPVVGQSIIASGSTNVFYDINPLNVRIVRMNPAPGEFSSVTAAIASIPVSPTPNFPTIINRWAVYIYTGFYEESQIIIPDWVSIIGMDFKTVCLNPSSLGYTFITMGIGCELAFLHIQNTDPLFDTIFIYNCGYFTSIYKVDFDNCAKTINCLTDGSATENSKIYIKNCIVSNIDTYIIHCRDTNILGGFGTCINVIGLNSIGHCDDAILGNGLNSDLLLQSTILEGNGTGNAIRVVNGFKFEAQSVHLHGWTNGLYSPSSSAGCKIFTDGIRFENCITNINVDVATTGYNTGYSEYLKNSIPKTAPFFLTNTDQRIITVAQKGGDFSSITAALDAITDNSVFSRYIIRVGPGIFVETQIVLKDYVMIKGSFRTQTLIVAHPSVAGTPFIIGAGYSAISNVTLAVASYLAPPSYLIEFLGHPTGIHFRVDDTIFDTSGNIIHIGSSLGETIFLLLNSVINTTAPFTNGVIIEDSAPDYNKIRFIIDNFIWSADAAGLINFIELFNIQSYKSPATDPNIFGAITNSSVGQNINIVQGNMYTGGGSIYMAIETSIISSFVNGVIILNTVEAPKIVITACTFNSNTVDIDIQSANAIGSITSTASIDKILFNSSNTTLGLAITDISGGIAFGGKIYQGDEWNIKTNISDQIQHASTTGSLDNLAVITDVGGLNISVSGGIGYVFLNGPPNYLKHITWSADPSFAIPDNSLSYIYVDGNGVLSSSTSQPSHTQNVRLGHVKTYGGAITYIQEVGNLIDNLSSNIDNTLRFVFGPIVSSGCLTTPGSNVAERAVAVSSGSYNLSVEEFTPVGGDNVSIIGYYDGTVETSPFTNIPLQYDNSGVLTVIPVGKWVKHAFYILSSLTGVTQYFMVYGQELFDLEVDAQAGPLPIPPTTFNSNMCPISGIIITDSDPSSPLPANRFRDIRPKLSFRSEGLSATSDHNSLLNLTVGDAHPQYFRTDGTRIMTGNIQLAGNNITGTGGNLLNGVDITSHASRHLPGGSDALSTAAPVTISTANSIGADASFSRSDHVHAHGDQTSPTLHAAVTSVNNGFMLASDKVILDAATATDTISTLMLRDTNANTAINNIKTGYTTTSTAAGTTVLTVASDRQQFFTGSTTQTLQFPLTSTLTTGFEYYVSNKSTGVITLNTNSSNSISTLYGGSTAIITCISTSGTGSANEWSIATMVSPSLNPQIMTVSTNVVSVGVTTVITSSLPWSNSRFGGYTTRTVTAWVVPSSDASKDLLIDVLPNGGGSLGSIVVGGGSAVGAIYQFNISNPGVDTVLQFEVSRTGTGGNNPIISGITLELS